MRFEWDDHKEKLNLKKHGVDFSLAPLVFDDVQAVITKDVKHSISEDRFYIVGKANGMVLTFRFTVRGSRIRIFGAGKGDWTK